jgi:AcrR family transcriptional regulator
VRGFDDAEKEEIRSALVDAGEEYFLRVGPQKTTVEDLTSEVGIATGSFYTFFDSKGALFLEIFRRLRDELVDDVTEAVDGVADGSEGIRLLFRTYLDWLEAHPIIQKLATDVEKGRFRRSLPTDEVAAAERERDEELARLVARWQENGTLRDDLPARQVVALLEPVALLAVTNDEYDDAYYEQRDAAIETLARGLEAEEQ